ncbi:Retrovirus-related Pol polyprotein from transposon 412, partial [Araneus ventricosus]
QPKTITDLRRFLALLNFYRRFLKNAAHEQSLLSDYLKGAKKNDTRLTNWTEEAKLAFESCKNSLVISTLLVYPSPDARLSLTCDASDRALGSVLIQEENGQWKSLAFFSRKLTPAEQRYSVYDRELLAVYASVRHFSCMLEGRNFTIYTDHKPLIYVFTQKHEKCSPRQIRHLDWIGQFSTDIRHISGKDIKAETVAFEFYANWIARFGVPERLTSDQSRQFESLLFREFARLLGVKVVHTNPYHPQANSSVERLHRQLKSAIRAHATER